MGSQGNYVPRHHGGRGEALCQDLGKREIEATSSSTEQLRAQADIDTCGAQHHLFGFVNETADALLRL